MVAQPCYPSLQEAEAGVRGQPGLNSEFKAYLEYTARACLKKTITKKKMRKVAELVSIQVKNRTFQYHSTLTIHSLSVYPFPKASQT